MIVYNNIESGMTEVYLGNQSIAQVYIGTNKVFPNSTPPTPYHFKAQYTNVDSTTGEVACNSSSILTYTDFPSTSNILHITVGECVDGFDTHLVDKMYSSLRTIDLAHSNITTVPQNFMNGVSTLRNAYLNESTTTISQYAFSGCTSLSAITIPSSITSINSNAFRNCGLREITYYSGITYGAYVYSHCSSLSSVTIEQGTTRIEQGTFASCPGLTSLTIPSSVAYIGTQAFVNCNNLSSITVNASNPPVLGSNVLDGSYPIYVPCESLSLYQQEWADYASRIACIPTPTADIIYTATTILNVNSTAFTPTATAETFDGGVGQIEFAEPVTAIGNFAFSDKTAMTNILIPNSITSIGVWAFKSCSSLTSIDIPNSVTGINQGAFGNCSGLTSCTLGSGVTSIGGYAFSNCSGLTSVNIPSGVTSIGENAFSNCSGLTSVNIPSGVTSIENDTFSNCRNLTSITIPNSVSSIGNYAFNNCRSLTSVAIGSGVTNIGNYTFYNCRSLTSITIPNSVSSIGNYAFNGCTSLQSLRVLAVTPPELANVNALANTNNCPIYVPAESVEAYKSTSVWSTYASRIQAIPNS